MTLRGEAQPAEHRGGSVARSAERGFTAAFELVATPALFGFIGYFLDRRLGTGPVLTISLAFIVSCYMVWKLWYQYNAKMIQLEAELIGKRTGQAPGTDS